MIILYRIMGFLIVASYLRVVPGLLPQGVGCWLLYAAGAIVLGRHVARLVGLTGLAACGAHTHYGWTRNVRLGFVLGFLIWTAMYLFIATYAGVGLPPAAKSSNHAEVQTLVDVKTPIVAQSPLEVESYLYALTPASHLDTQPFEVANHLDQPSPFQPEHLIQLPALLLAPLLYELLIRGYLYAHLGPKLTVIPFIIISSAICALESVWSTGFSGWMALLAFGMGLPLSYAMYRTGAIWLSVGMHLAIVLTGAIWQLAVREGAAALLLLPPASLIASILLLLGAMLLLAKGRINVNPALRDTTFRK